MIIEQRALQESARRLLAGAGAPHAAWAAMVEAGWPALTAPDSLGGLDQPLEAACWIYSELGRSLSPLELLPSLLAVATLRAAPATPARDAWIERIAAGERIAMSLRAPSTHAAADGIIQAMLGAGHAEYALIWAGNPACLAAIRLRQPGVDVIARPTWDISRALSDLHIADTLPADSHILATGAAALAARNACESHLHFAIAADCAGAAAAALEATVAYLKTRQQFGRPLALFQALKHRCADLMASLAAAEAVLADYAHQAEAATPAARLALARGAKANASIAFRHIAEDSIQLHGGMGMTDEHPCHRFLKRALLNEQLASANDACLIAVGENILRVANP